MLPNPVREAVPECTHKNLKYDPHQACVSCRVKIWGIQGLCSSLQRCTECANTTEAVIFERALSSAVKNKNRRLARQKAKIQQIRDGGGPAHSHISSVGTAQSVEDLSIKPEDVQAQSTPRRRGPAPDTDTDGSDQSDRENDPAHTESGLPILNLSFVDKVLEGVTQDTLFHNQVLDQPTGGGVMAAD